MNPIDWLLTYADPRTIRRRDRICYYHDAARTIEIWACIVAVTITIWTVAFDETGWPNIFVGTIMFGIVTADYILNQRFDFSFHFDEVHGDEL